MDAEQRQRFADYRDDLAASGRTRPASGSGAEYDYQRRWCGPTEYRITTDDLLPRAAWADGLDDIYGLAQDAKYVHHAGRSWFRPDSLPPRVQRLAEQQLDDRLIKYREAINHPGNPIRGLEVIVNDPDAARHIAARMADLRVPGIVRIQPDKDP